MADAQANAQTPHETRDMSARLSGGIILLASLFVPLCGAVLWLLFQTLWQSPPYRSLPSSDISERAASAPPLIPNPGLTVPKSIQLMEKRLHSVGWIDREAGIVHMPIDRAMGRLLKHGMADDLFPLPSPERTQRRAGASSDMTHEGDSR